MQGKKRFAFICGVSRSGTTAMADLLRADPRIAMGRERYAFILSSGAPYEPSLFEKDRFCLDHRPEDSHHKRAQPYYAELHARFDQCTVVGDKLPNLFEGYERVLDHFPSCRVIYMLRNVFHVAQSFQGRHDKAMEQNRDPERPNSPWPEWRDWKRGVEEWNRSLEETAKRAASHDFHVFPYERMFAEDALLERLFDYLGMPVDPAVRKSWDSAKATREELEGSRSLRFRSEQMEWIMQHARFDLYQELAARCTV